MRSILLPLFVLANALVYGQCVPYATTDAGTYPPILDEACFMVAYNDTATIVYPVDTLVSGLTFIFDSLRIDSIVGLPQGLNYSCNDTDCMSYPPAPGLSARQCIEIFGTPTTVMSVSVALVYVTSWVTSPQFGSVSSQGVWDTLQLGQPSTSSIVEAACDNYTSPSGNYIWSSSGIYADTIPSTVGCGDSIITINLTINTVPESVWTYSTSGLTVDFTNSSNGNPTFQLWDYGDGNTSTAFSPSHTYAQSGVYTTCMTVSNDCGADSACADITVCNLSIDDAGASNPSCNGMNDGQIQISASGGIGNVVYSIDNGITFQAGASFTGLGPGTYSLVVEDNEGCQDTATVTLIDPEVLEISQVGLNDPDCNGESNGSISIIASGGTAPLQYSIDNGVTYQQSFSFNGLPAFNYNVVVQDALGCEDTSSVTLSDPEAVVIYDVITVDPSCYDETDGSLTISAMGQFYFFSIDSGATFQIGDSVFNSLGAATYNVLIQNVSGCQTSTTAELIDPMPVDTSVIFNEPTITVNSSGTYQWLDCGSMLTIPSETGQSFTASVSGSYAVIVTEGACTATSNCYSISIPVGLPDRRSEDAVLIYPNPTTSTIRIQLPENNLKASRTGLYDMTGRLVHQQPFNPNMDVGYLDRGTYIVVVETEEGNFRGTVQKQ